MYEKLIKYRIPLTLLMLMLVLAACVPNVTPVDVGITREPELVESPTSSPATPMPPTNTPFPATAVTQVAVAAVAGTEMAETATAVALTSDMLTRLALPTETPMPTLAPSPTVTLMPTAVPPDVVWMEAAWIYDGGLQMHDRYRSKYMPIFVLQADGRFIWQHDISSFQTNWYEETMLTVEQMCHLRAELIETGVFTFDGRVIYKIDELTDEQLDLLNGSGPFQMNWLLHGDPAASVPIPYEGDFLDKLVDEFHNAWTILNTYWPEEGTPYIAEETAVFIQIGLDEEVNQQPVAPWPADLPMLAALFDLGVEFNLVEGYPGVEVILRGEELAQLQEAFGYGTMEGAFHEGDVDYFVMLRPLLPMDRTDQLWASLRSGGGRVNTYPLPFNCDV